ncbi:MAG TPA: ABC transporter, partial [Solibacterales bacterium]|nr:ABC transporter [Bryobacterales bacterium]
MPSREVWHPLRRQDDRYGELVGTVISPAVQIENLTKRYGSKLAVDGFSLQVETGSIFAILGPNGAGKTTTVECCEGFRKPDFGVVRVLGLNPTRDGRRLRPRIGVMLQSGGVYPAIRAEEMLRHVAKLHAHPIDPSLLILRLALASAGKSAYRKLSGGERQRLAFALAIVGRPDLVFLDEPTAGLDPQGRLAVWDLICELRDAGVTVVLTTHSMDEAERLADRLAIVDHGRVVAAGTIQDLTGGPASGSITFHAAPNLAIDSLRSLLPSDFLVQEQPPGHYAIVGDLDPWVIAKVTAWCAARDVMPHGLRVGHRTLEEVFL